MLDTKIVGGTIVDGTGSAGFAGDVGIRDGRVVAVGAVSEDAIEIIDAAGFIVAPGLIDPHTHYDAQLFWDPYASPSNIHGVTTVIGGNCGFTIAPLEPGDGDYLRRLMAKVEGMDLAALENGLDWDWETFADWIDRLDGNIGVNAGFLVGHCAIRRKVMGADAVGQEATGDQIAAMEQLLAESIEAGGLGFSTGRGNHEDGNGDPVPSRWATDDEILRLCRVTGQHEGTTLEVILHGCLDKFADDEIEFITAMSVEGQRPVNWNVLTVDSAAPDRHPRQLGAGEYAASKGGRVVALTMPTIVGMNMNFGTFCAFNLIPKWGDVLSLPLAERMEKLRDPEVRSMMDTVSHSEEAGVFRRLADWGGYRIGDTFSPENKPLERRYVHEIAEERGTGHFDTLVDIVLADDLRTVLWPSPTDNDDASWELRQEVWDHPHAMLGGSDAGAHLDRMCGAPYGTAFLRDVIRGRKLVSLERAVQMLTSEPAELFGLRDRGVLRDGAHADVFVFDPDEVGCEPIYMRTDLPGEGKRLYAEPLGVKRVIVNGVTTVIDGEQVDGALPGTLIKPGRDTETVLP